MLKNFRADRGQILTQYTTHFKNGFYLLFFTRYVIFYIEMWQVHLMSHVISSRVFTRQLRGLNIYTGVQVHGSRQTSCARASGKMIAYLLST